MENFIYNTPTKVIFGQNTQMQVGSLIKEYKATKVLVHYGTGSVVKSGLIEQIYQSLNQAGLDYVSLGGVVPNPRLGLVYEGIELCKKEQVDFILAVGGGSVIDSAKAIGIALANPDIDIWDFYDARVNCEACLPIGCVLTIAAAGSEMSSSSVITKEEGMLKRGAHSEASRPKFSISNPELTYTLPPYQTASGCVDIMMHTMERYLVTTEVGELTDYIAIGLIKTMMKNAQILKADPLNYNARAEVMWAGSLSHNGLTGCGRTNRGDWATHQIEHELGGKYDCAHGAGLSALWGSWARYVLHNDPERFAKFAINALDCEDTGNNELTALAGVEKLEIFFTSIDMPISIKELGFAPTDEDIADMAEKCTYYGRRTVGTMQKLNAEDIKEIYKMAL